jgi:hypothetical protein
MNTSRLLSALLLFSLSPSIPSGVSTSLAGEKVDLPKDLHGPVSFLIVGFSQKSADQATEWGKAMDGLEPCHGQLLTWYQLPVIAGAPGILRPLIMRSMRSGLTHALQQHFVPITDHEADWKLAAGYQATDPQKDDAYILATDEKGQIVAKWHGSRQSSEQLLNDVYRRYCLNQ